jgi:hypothetical protein
MGQAGAEGEPPMTISYTENDATKVAEIVVSNRITWDDYKEVVNKMQAFIDRHGKVKLVEIIKSFSGFDPSVILPGIKFDWQNIQHISHVAVVTDIGWMGPMSKAAGALLSTKLRTFDLEHLEEARRWIAEA